MVRRKRKERSKQPISVVSIWTSAVGGVALLGFCALMVYAVLKQGEVGKFAGGIGLCAFVACIVCVPVGYKAMQQLEYRLLQRLMGFFVPLAGLLLWLALYLFGLLFA